MNSRIIAGLLVWGMISLSACHKSRHNRSHTRESGTLADSLTSALPVGWVPFDEKEANFQIQETDFDYLTAKAKFSFRNNKQDIDNATINFRVKKDSLIWFSVTAVGFEVARGIISPQEMILLDKFHKDYYAYSYPELSQRFKFDLSYPLLQALLVGNLPQPRQLDQRLYRGSTPDRLLLRQPGKQMVIDNYIGQLSQRVESLRVVQQSTQNTLTLDYSDFQKLEGYLFPFATLMVLHTRAAADQATAPTEIRLNHSKVDLTQNNPGFPFSVPSSYKKR
jgi:hypothetical protein